MAGFSHSCQDRILIWRMRLPLPTSSPSGSDKKPPKKRCPLCLWSQRRTRPDQRAGPHAKLSVEPEQGARLWKLVHREIAPDGRETLAQFLPVATVALIAKRSEPTFNSEPG
jgi:hypothetical protein